MNINEFDSIIVKVEEIFQTQGVDNKLSFLNNYLNRHIEPLKTDEEFQNILKSCHEISKYLPENEKVQQLWVHALQGLWVHALKARGFFEQKNLNQFLDTLDKEILSAKEFDEGLERWLNDPEFTDKNVERSKEAYHSGTLSLSNSNTILLATRKKNEAFRRIKNAYKNCDTFLDLSGLQLISLPKEIKDLQDLKTLDVSENLLSSLPPEIGNLQDLKILDVSDNLLSSLPPEIGNLHNLKTLKVSSNVLSSLPPEIGNLHNLKNLLFSWNKVSSLPPEIGNLHNLENLCFSSNKVSSLPPEIGNLQNLKTLKVSSNVLSSLPPEIGNLHNLEKLQAEKNKVSSLPPEIGNLHNLKDLTFYRNELSALPPQIGSLQNLETLDVVHNELSALPPQIGNLQNLKKLEINSNKLSVVPAQIGNLQNLKALDFYRNELSALPPQIGSLQNLETLDVSHNRFTSLPAEIGNLFNLSNFIFYNNPSLETLPISIGNIFNITSLNNTKTQIPHETIDRLLKLCEAMRNPSALETSPRLRLWRQCAKTDYDLVFITQLEEKKQRSINKWLQQLEKTSDFSHHQQSLANIVCSILETLKTNRDFSDLFFTQVDANLECCQDRAAMSLNEVFTSWKLCSIDENTPLAEKLELLAGNAKTNVLRKELAQAINKGHQTSESVEIYLYYETLLQNELGLVTAIKNMNYEAMGQRDWINKKTLVEAVNNNYLEEMIQLDAFKALAKTDPSYQTAIIQIEKFHEKKHNNIDLDAEDYAQQIQKLGREREEALNQCAIKWAKQNLPKSFRKRKIENSLPENKRLHRGS